MRASLPVVHFVAIQTEAGGLQLHGIKCTGAAGLQSKTRPTSEQWFVGPVRFCRLGGSLNYRTRPRLRDGLVVPSGDDVSGDLKQSRRAAIEIGRPRVVQSSRVQHRRVFSLGLERTLRMKSMPLISGMFQPVMITSTGPPAPSVLIS